MGEKISDTIGRSFRAIFEKPDEPNFLNNNNNNPTGLYGKGYDQQDPVLLKIWSNQTQFPIRLFETFAIISTTQHTKIHQIAQEHCEAITKANAQQPLDDQVFQIPAIVNSAELLSTIPSTAKNEPMIKQIPKFTFPKGIGISFKQQPSIKFSFILTNSIGGRFSVGCLTFYEKVRVKLSTAHEIFSGAQFIYIPKTLVLISRHRMLVSISHYLEGLHNLVFEKKYSDVPIEQYLHSLVLEVPGSEENVEMIVEVPLDQKIYEFPLWREHNPKGLPLLDFSLRYLFMCLSVDNVIRLFRSVLSEKKILFVSSQYSLLTICAESILSLIYPFKWIHVYVPILPFDLLEYLEAPTPFIMGTHRSNVVMTKLQKMDLVVVDLDFNSVSFDSNQLISLPPAVETELRNTVIPQIWPEIHQADQINTNTRVNLFDPKSASQHQIQIAFFKFFSCVLSGFNRYIRPNQTLDQHEFLEDIIDSRRKSFVERFLQTQLFENAESMLVDQECPLVRVAQMGTEWDKKHIKFLEEGFSTVLPKIKFPKPLSNAQTAHYSHFPQLETTVARNNLPAFLHAISHYVNLHKSPQLYYYLAMLYLLDKQLIPALQSLDSALTISPSFKLTQEMISFLYNLLFELEAQPSWYTSKGYQPFSATSPIKLLLAKGPKDKLQLEDEQVVVEKSNITSDIKSRITSLLRTTKDAKKVSQTQFVRWALGTGLCHNRDFAVTLCSVLQEWYLNQIETSKLFEALNSINNRNPRYFEAPLIDPDEVVLKQTSSSELSSERGTLYLTNKRLIFALTDKKQTPLIVKLTKLVSVEKFNYTIIIPPGLPCIKVTFHTGAQIETRTWIILKSRTIWFQALNQIIIGERIYKDLFTSKYLDKVRYRVLITEMAQIVTKNDKILSLLPSTHPSTFGALRLKAILEERALNQDAFGELTPEAASLKSQKTPTKFVEFLLSLIYDLFFCFFSPDIQGIDYSKLKQSAEYRRFRDYSVALQSINILGLDEKQTICFFVNLYNIMMIHAFLMAGFPKNYLEFQYICRSAWYLIQGFPITLDFIFHGILRANSVNPYVQLTSKMKFQQDPRFQLISPEFQKYKKDPRIHFLLSNHCKTSPVLYQVSEENLDTVLQVATEEFVATQVSFETSSKEVVLPKVFKWYKDDFGGTTLSVVSWVKTFVKAKQEKEMRRLLKSDSVSFRFVYNWKVIPAAFRQSINQQSK